ncbi:MAG: prepilin-type N-terminal cleavage/methylation domain-containing protein, partial [Thermoanaerobaculia bacterium]|nr:prepilin-type N-terminal cleavage/methylation domain-containing protein [Thermoanaerobaculia bacterium]
PRNGYTLVEALVAVALAALLALVTVPPLLRGSGRARVRLAAAEVTAALRLARALAARHATPVALRFESLGGERIGYAIYRDGDGDGVRRDDIAAGTDPLVVPRQELSHLGRGAGFGFAPGPAPRDPGDPRRRLDRLDDPIRFNQSDLASFGPFGQVTPGSVYLTDGARHQAVVRVFGRTGRTHVLWYDPDVELWR